MQVTGTIVNQGPRRFGRSVEAEIDRHRAAAIARVRGRLLDLAEPAARAELAAVVDTGEVVDGRYDAVVSCAELVRFPDLAAALGAIDTLLAPEGRVELFEPIARPGTAALFLAAPFTRLPATSGFHLGRDLPVALRTTSLVADDLERVTMRTSIPTLRHFVVVTARRAVPTSSASTSSSSSHSDPEVRP